MSQPLRTRDVNVAIKLAVQYNERIENQHVPIGAVLAEDRVTFEELAEAYLASRVLRPRSIKAYRSILSNFNRVASALAGRSQLLIKDVTADLVSRYATARRNEPTARNGHPNTRKTLDGASIKTVREEVHLIAAIMNYAVERSLLPVAPSLQSIIRELTQNRNHSDVARPLFEEETKALLAAAREYDSQREGSMPYSNYFFALFSAFLYTGLRVDEMRHLRWQDVIQNEQTILIRHKKLKIKRAIHLSEAARKSLESLMSGKSRRHPICTSPEEIRSLGRILNFRDVQHLETLSAKQVDLESGIVTIDEQREWRPKGIEGKVLIHPELDTIFTELKAMATSDFVFPHADGGPWRFHVNKHLKAVCEIAKIADPPRAHDFRHSLGANLRRAGVGLETIKEILRHARIEDTLRYAKYEKNEGWVAILKLPKWDGSTNNPEKNGE